MSSYLALITKKKYWRWHSFWIKLILKLYGIHVGRGFYIEGTPRLKIRGSAKNIIIGDNVNMLGNVDIRNRENGRIIIGDNVTIENDCRFVAARDGVILIGANTGIGAFSIFNGGADIKIGEWCAISVRVTINANEHKFARDERIREQGFVHAPVLIEDDCLIGANVAINKGVTIKKGSVIGASAVVTKDTDEFSINAGIPAVKIGERV